MPKLALELTPETMTNIKGAVSTLEEQLGIQMQPKNLVRIVLANMTSEDLLGLYQDHVKNVMGFSRSRSKN